MSIIFPNVTYNVALFNFIEFKCQIFLILCQIFNQFSATVTIGFRPKTGGLTLRGRNNNNWGK